MRKRLLPLIVTIAVVVLTFSCFVAHAGDHIICVDYNAGMTAVGDLTFFGNVTVNENPGDISGYDISYTCLCGWFGSNLSGNYSFGYSINDGEIVTDNAFARGYEDPVRVAIDNGVDNPKFYSRYVILAPIQYGISVNVKYFAIPDNDSGNILLGSITYKRPSPVIDKISNIILINGSEIKTTVQKSNGVEDGTILFEESTKILVNAITGEEFNRISINYSLNTPISAKVIYTVNNKEYEDTLVFPVSDNETITQCLKGFLSGVKATKIKKIELTNESDVVAKLKIKSINTSTVSVTGESAVTLQNDKLKVEIDLTSGGKIINFDCLSDNIDAENSLITETGEEILVSYTKGYNYVYVKTISEKYQGYFERRYVLHDDYLEVSNNIRFFNSAPDEETLISTCSFNALGSLGTFAYYPGENSWKGGSLKKITDVLTEEAHTTNNKLSGNTETWGALVNNENNGVGIYQPNADNFKIYMNGKQSYISPEIYGGSVKENALSFTYLLSAGELDEIRKTFETAKDNIEGTWVEQEDFVQPEESTPTPETTPDNTVTPEPSSTPEPTGDVTEKNYKFEGNWFVSIGVMVLFLGVVLFVVLANKKSK